MPEYSFVKSEDVRAACQKLGLSDWSISPPRKVSPEEAEIIRSVVGSETHLIPLDGFIQGLETELEHGASSPDSNVTNNHPVLTGKIVLAHLREGLDYYPRLRCMELEMKLNAAIAGGNPGRAAKKRLELAQARAALENMTIQQMEPA